MGTFPRVLKLGLGSLALAAPIFAQTGSLTLSATNEIQVSRPSETIVLKGQALQPALATDDLRKIHVKDAQSGQELLTQAVDVDGDSKMDELLFQADFSPGQTRAFILTVGARSYPTREQFKAYGRFVRERYDDFAWENDRIAHRMYGKALETWQAEPLTSSTVDVWCKRVRRLVINDWYMMDNYHSDHGEGADFYSAGKSRGCGGSSIWAGGKLWGSRNFVQSRVIACGPIRVMFELTYEPWDAAGRKVSEVKRITLDAGQNLDRFESFYKIDQPDDIVYAAGIKKAVGSTVVTNKERGWLRTWEAVKNAGNLGCALIVDPKLLVEYTEGDGNYLAVVKDPAGAPATYYAGFGWDQSGDFAGVQDWERYVDQFAQRLQSPLKVTLGATPAK